MKPNIFKSGENQIIAIIFFSFIITYLLFYIIPTFINVTQNSMYVSKPILNPVIGGDLKWVLNDGREVLGLPIIEPDTLDDIPLYGTPVTYILFGVLGLLSHRRAYYLFTAIQVLLFFFMPFIGSKFLKKKEGFSISPSIILILILGSSSYGLEYELQMGQYDIFSISLCILGVYIFHQSEKQWQHILAILLISIGFQLKIQFFLLILCLVRPDDTFKTLIKRGCIVSLINLSLLLIAGYQRMLNYIVNLMAANNIPSYQPNHHSIRSFAYFQFQVIPLESLGLTPELVRWVLAIIVICCVLLTLKASLKSSFTMWGKYGLVVYSIAGCLLMPLSQDYRLAALVLPFTILLGNLSFEMNDKKLTYFQSCLLFIAVTSLQMTFYRIDLRFYYHLWIYRFVPLTYVLSFITNAAPMLITIVVSITAFLLSIRSKHNLSHAAV